MGRLWLKECGRNSELRPSESYGRSVFRGQKQTQNDASQTKWWQPALAHVNASTSRFRQSTAYDKGGAGIVHGHGGKRPANADRASGQITLCRGGHHCHPRKHLLRLKKRVATRATRPLPTSTQFYRVEKRRKYFPKSDRQCHAWKDLTKHVDWVLNVFTTPTWERHRKSPIF